MTALDQRRYRVPGARAHVAVRPHRAACQRAHTRAELSIDLVNSTALPPDLRVRVLRALERLVDGELWVVVDETRSQRRNRQLARRRRLQSKRRRGELKRSRRRPDVE